MIMNPTKTETSTTPNSWRDMHSSAGAVRQRPVDRDIIVESVAKIIGWTPSDLAEEGCDRACQTDGGTCICAGLYRPAAEAILTYLAAARWVGQPSPVLTQCDHPDCKTWRSAPCGEGCYWQPARHALEAKDGQ